MGTEHNDCFELKLRYVYILEVDNKGRKSKFFGHTKIFYAGQTSDLARRINQHTHGLNNTFLKNNFQFARKKLVFVDYVYGDESDAMIYESRLKYRLNRAQKIRLINSDINKLVRYVPFKVIILKKYKNDDEQIALKLKTNSDE